MSNQAISQESVGAGKNAGAIRRRIRRGEEMKIAAPPKTPFVKLADFGEVLGDRVARRKETARRSARLQLWGGRGAAGFARAVS